MLRRKGSGPVNRGFCRHYDLALALQYKLDSGERGAGVTICFDREALMMCCQEHLPLGEIVEVEIAWPVLARGRDAVVLRVHGVIVRSEGNTCAVSVGKRAFVIAARGNSDTAAAGSRKAAEDTDAFAAFAIGVGLPASSTPPKADRQD